jgi:hypothetical protein
MDGVEFVTRAEGRAMFEKECLRRAGVTAGEFLAALDNGEAEDRFGHHVTVALEIMRPFWR